MRAWSAKVHEEFGGGGTEMLYILILVVVTQVYTYVYLKEMYFIVCKLYPNNLAFKNEYTKK